jgi:hypothetical protein
MAVPPLVRLLKERDYEHRLTTVSALTKLADFGEFVAVCYLGIANTSVKSNFVRRLKATSHRSFNCLKSEPPLYSSDYAFSAHQLGRPW